MQRGEESCLDDADITQQGSAKTFDHRSVPLEASKAIATILDDGDIPLVSIPTNGKLHVTRALLEEDRAQVEFTAISHVRSQDLALRGESFISCLQRLQHVVNDLPRSGGVMSVARDTNVPWWIDTLCIPEDHRRKPAKRNIKRVFAAATAVLVLEIGLCNHAWTSNSERLAAVRHSPWIGRLWTLQEAALAKRLYFRFSEASFVLEDIVGLQTTAQGDEGRTQVHTAQWEDHRLGAEDREKLECLDRFDEYIKSIFTESISTHKADQSRPTKSHLKSILRLGYLSLPRFRLISDPTEYAESQAVIERIVNLYRAKSAYAVETSKATIGNEDLVL